VLYAGQGQYEKAKIALEKALRTHPSYATAHENLGDIYAKMASQAYDRALQLDRSKSSPATKLATIKDMQTPVGKVSVTKTQLASASASPAPAPVAASPVSAVATAAAPAAGTEPATPKPATAKPAVAEAANTGANDEVLKALNDWAAAWSARNANKYLAMYAKEFKTPNNETRSSWKSSGANALASAAIVVTVSNARVKMRDDSHATVSFIQSYRSGALKSTTARHWK